MNKLLEPKWLRTESFELQRGDSVNKHIRSILKQCLNPIRRSLFEFQYFHTRLAPPSSTHRLFTCHLVRSGPLPDPPPSSPLLSSPPSSLFSSLLVSLLPCRKFPFFFKPCRTKTFSSTKIMCFLASRLRERVSKIHGTTLSQEWSVLVAGWPTQLNGSNQKHRNVPIGFPKKSKSLVPGPAERV